MLQNHIELIGCLASAPRYSHSNHGRSFYRFYLEVARLSGAIDRLPILTSLELLEACGAEEGESLRLTGQIRSFNNRAQGGRRLIISVLAETLEVCNEAHDNRVQLRGVICKEPVYRRTPLGREICDVMLAVNRAYRRADYLPCILWGRCARDTAECSVGTELELQGRLQSRTYIKMVEDQPRERIAYEISAISAQSLSGELPGDF